MRGQGGDNRLRDADKQKDVVHACANKNCRVPSCAVCLLPMDMLNPFLEFKRQQNKDGGKNYNANFGMGLGMSLGLSNPALGDANKFGSVNSFKAVDPKG